MDKTGSKLTERAGEPFYETRRRVATALDVARRAEVSRATVSRCFTPGAPVNPHTKSRVLSVARELGYEPNLLGRMLNKQESRIVAVLTSDFENPFQPALLQTFTENLLAEGLIPLLMKTASADEPADELIQLALSYRVAAIVVTVLSPSDSIIRRCFDAEIPLILLNRVAEDSRAISVCSDLRSGGARAADILIEGGHTRIAMITGRQGTWTNSMRRGGFSNRLDELGVDVIGQESGNYTYEGGCAAARTILAKAARIDAIYACNDAMAFGAMDVIRQHGKKHIPDDVAVIGFDDVPMARWGAYRLSTIHQPVNRLIEHTRQILMRPDHGLALSRKVFFYKGRFIQRGSTRPVELHSDDVDERLWQQQET